MASIKIIFTNDSEVVWFWELCKKLGFEKLEVVFGNFDTDSIDKLDDVPKGNQQYSDRPRENSSCEATVKQTDSCRNGGNKKNRDFKRLFTKNSR